MKYLYPDTLYASSVPRDWVRAVPFASLLVPLRRQVKHWLASTDGRKLRRVENFTRDRGSDSGSGVDADLPGVEAATDSN